MTQMKSTALLLLVGCLFALGGLTLANPVHGVETWLGFAGVYLFSGILLGIPRIVGLTDSTTFRYASFVAVISVLVPIGTRAWRVLSARPELTLPEASFILLGFQVLIPFVVAFMALLGVAETQLGKLLASGVVLVPFLVGTALGVSSGDSQSYLFIIYYILSFFAGVVAGLPTYFYGRSLRGRLPLRIFNDSSAQRIME